MIKFISRLDLAGSRVDRERGIIKGVSLIAKGEARGHDKMCDQRTLETVRDCAQEYKDGLRVKFNPSTFQHGVGSLLGYIPAKSVRIEGDKTVGDLHVYEYFPNDAKEYLYEIAERTPGNIGLSIEFTGDDEVIDDNKFARCDQIFAATVVDLPAANPTGLFAESEEAKKPYGDVDYADPGYQSDKQKRYPIDNEDHVRAAWSYINKEKNAGKYSSEDLTKIKGRIKSAAKKHGIEISEEMTMDEATIKQLSGAIAAALKPVILQAFADATPFPPPTKEKDGDEKDKQKDENGDGDEKEDGNGDKEKMQAAKVDEGKKPVAQMTAQELTMLVTKANMQFFTKTGNSPVKTNAEPKAKSSDPFIARVEQHMVAGAKSRGLAIHRARKDSPQEYNEWMAKKNSNAQQMVQK
jgi:hypothetical protein